MILNLALPVSVLPKSPKPNPLRPPIKVALSSQITDVLRNEIGSIQVALNEFNVKITMNESEGMLLSPSHETKDGWEVLCANIFNRYIQERIIEVSLEIPEKALTALLPILMQIQKTKKCFSYIPPVQGKVSSLHHFAGDRNIIQQVKDELEKINSTISTSEQFTIDDERFAYVSQLKLQDIVHAFSTVKIT